MVASLLKRSRLARFVCLMREGYSRRWAWEGSGFGWDFSPEDEAAYYARVFARVGSDA